MMKTPRRSSDIEDFSKYEPLRLNQCTVIPDLKRFFDTYKAIVVSYESKGKKRLAEPFKKRAILAMKLINEMDEKWGEEE